MTPGAAPQLAQSSIPAGLTTVTVAATIPANTTGGINTVTLSADNTNIVSGMSVTGPGNSVGLGAKVVSVSGTTVTLSVPNVNTPETPAALTFSSEVVAIAAGYYHSVALRSDGSIVAWGDNSEGQTTVPSGMNTYRGVAVTMAAPVLPDTNISNYKVTLSVVNANIVPGLWVTGPPGTVGAGAIITAKAGNTLTLSVPNMNSGALGPLLTFSPVAPVVAIAAGFDHTVALKSDGTVVAWGRNIEGQTAGLATVTASTTLNISPYPVGTSNSTVTLTAANAGIVPGMWVTGPALTVGAGATVVSKDASGLIVTLSVPNVNTITKPGTTLTFSSVAKAIAIVAGGDATYILKDDGTVQAFGDNTHGQASIPPGLTGVKTISTGGDHAVALKNDGTVVTWGKIWNGSAFLSETVPVGLNGVSTIAAGAYHTMALAVTQPPIITTQPASVTVNQGGTASFTVTAAGTAPLFYQWRKNGVTLSNTGNIFGANTATLALTNAQLIDASNYSVVVTDASGSVTSTTVTLTVNAAIPEAVVAWGAGTTNSGFEPEYGQSIIPAGLSGVTTAIAGGLYHSVALKNDGSVVAWGNNSYDQTTVPDGLSTVSAVATLLSTVTAVATLPANPDGYLNTVTITVSATANTSFVPATIVPGMLVTGPTDTLGTGAVVFRKDTSGNVTTLYLSVPNAYSTFAADATLTFTPPAAWGHAAAITVTPTVNTGFVATSVVAGMLVTGPPGTVGAGATVLSTTTSNDYETNKSVTILSLSAAHAVSPVGDIFLTIYPAPPVTAIAAGGFHTLALKSNGSVVAWGAGTSVTPGAAPQLAQSSIPAGLTTVTVAATIPANTTGGINTVTLSAANTKIAVGMSVTGPGNTVGLGAKVVSVSGTTVTLSVPNVNTPVTPAALTFSSEVVAIAAGYYHSVALKSDGSIVAWGDNSEGQTTVPSGINTYRGVAVTMATPVLPTTNISNYKVTLSVFNANIVPGLLVTGPPGTVGAGAIITAKAGNTLTLSVPNMNSGALGPLLTFSPVAPVVAIAAGFDHTVALKSDGTVVAWGRNVEGQTAIPSGLNGVAAIAAGGDFTMALKSDGTVVAWGDNFSGQVTGTPTPTYPYTATANPVTLNGVILSGVTAIAAGGDHAVALKSDGTVVTWGTIWNGYAYVSETVSADLSGVTAIAAGVFHTIAIVGGPPITLTSQPVSRTNVVGTTAAFSVTATGTAPLTYQWRKNGTNLTNSGSITGATTATLTLANVQLTDASRYSVVVSDAYGNVTSTTATLTVIANPLADAVDSPELVWTSGGAAPWFAQTTTTHDGVDAARSGAITGSQESWMQTILTGPGTLSFWWKVSSEDTWDFLEFYLDGVLQSGHISGETGWQQVTLTIPAGSHTVKWRYTKDAWDNSGQDAGWVDAVNFVPYTVAPQIVTQPESRMNVAGTTATFTVEAACLVPLSYQWLKSDTALTNGGNISGAATATLSIANVQLTDIGSYSVVVTGSGYVTSTAATLTLAPPLVTTGAASGITATTATLNGTANPNGLASTARFEYGLTPAYGSKLRVTLAPDNGTSTLNVSVSLSGLQAGKTYHYRLTATSGGGASPGGDMTFQTPAVPIVAADLAAPKMEICDGNVNLTVQASVPGRGYQLQCSDTMATGTWKDLGAVKIGDGNILVISTPCDPAVQRRFYRLALQD